MADKGVQTLHAGRHAPGGNSRNLINHANGLTCGEVRRMSAFVGGANLGIIEKKLSELVHHVITLQLGN